MRAETLSYLKCPTCGGALTCSGSGELVSGNASCSACSAQYPILGGVLVLVADVHAYLVEHAKGIARHVPAQEIPKKYRADFTEALEGFENEHIEDDLEAERVTALYVMTHYLRAGDVQSRDPVLRELIDKHWDHGPFARIKELLTKRGEKPRSLVELGCGVGGLYPALHGQVSSYLGLDSSFASIALARRLALGLPDQRRCLVPDDLLLGPVSREIQVPKPAASSDRADFIVCDLASPPLKPGLWEMSAALNVIDMLPEPRALPRLQHQLLGAKGIAIQSCPYIWHPQVASELRTSLPRQIRDSAQAVERLYQEAGFKIDDAEAHVPWLFFKNNRQLEIYSVHVFIGKRI